MKNIQYLEILKKSLRITWENKKLWFLGFLIFLSSILSGVSSTDWKEMLALKYEEQASLLTDFVQKNLVLSVSVIFLIIALVIVLFLLRLIATAGIIKTVGNIAVYKQSSLGSIFSEAKKYAGKLFLLELVIGVILGVIASVVVSPVVYLFAVKEMVFFFISLMIAAVIIISLFVIAYFLRRYAYFYIVFGNIKIKMAMELAYRLFKKNFKESLVMGFISVGTSLVIAGALLIPVFLFSIIFLIVGGVAYSLFAKIGGMVIAIIGATGIIIFLIVMFSWYMAFLQTVWTLFFQEISLEKKEEKKAAEKIESVEKIPNPETV